jgi:phosphoribosyl-AMP cyclohydrolase
MRDRNAPLTASGLDSLDWAKGGGLIPAIVQDSATLQLLMLGYMNRESLEATLASGLVTFYSRSRAALWRKGETSGNLLRLDGVHCDCDGDALLVLCRPEGPTCHLGTPSCFTAEGPQGIGFVAELQRIIERRSAAPPEESYTARMMAEGRGRRRAGAGRGYRRQDRLHRGGGRPRLPCRPLDAGAWFRLVRRRRRAAPPARGGRAAARISFTACA